VTRSEHLTVIKILFRERVVKESRCLWGKKNGQTNGGHPGVNRNGQRKRTILLWQQTRGALPLETPKKTEFLFKEYHSKAGWKKRRTDGRRRGL